MLKFKYNLGERVLFRTPQESLNDSEKLVPNGSERVGIVTLINVQITKSGTDIYYQLDNNTLWQVTDAEILGKVVFHKAPVSRNRKPKPKVDTTTLSDNSKQMDWTTQGQTGTQGTPLNNIRTAS